MSRNTGHSLRPLALSMILLGGCSSAALDDLLEVASGSRELDRETVVAGLREALEIGSDRTIDRTAVIDGFLGNQLIRILIPEDLDKWPRLSGSSASVGRLTTSRSA